MPRRASLQPTDLELLILQTLWNIGPATVRQVRDALLATRPLAYTSVQTTMTVMLRKKLLRRRMVDGAGLFSAVKSAEKIRGSMLTDLIGRVFGGSPSAMVLHLLEADDVDEAELKAIQALLDRNKPKRSR